jgi:CheY-like chemotaxis protein
MVKTNVSTQDGGVVKRKILVVEDDETFRTTISEILSEKYSVYQAPDGRSACEVLSIQNFDLVLTDVQMPRMSGVELLEWTKKNNKNTPFIIMTGFSTLLETQSAFDLGAKGFVTKPFTIAQLLKMVPEAMAVEDKPTAPAAKTITDFYKVSIDEFVSKPVIDFDIYIRLSDTKFVKIANKNEELPKAQLSQYKTRGVKYFYIEKADFSKLVQFNLDLAKVINSQKQIPAEKKLAFMKYTGDIILERTFTDGVNPESLKDADAFLKLSLESIAESDVGFELLNILNGYSDKLYADALATSLYSVLVAKQRIYARM